jgi:hypothetical protein
MVPVRSSHTSAFRLLLAFAALVAVLLSVESQAGFLPHPHAKRVLLADAPHENGFATHLYHALSMSDSPLLTRSNSVVFLRDQRHRLSVRCAHDAKSSTHVCAVESAQPTIGWTRSEHSAQATLFRGLTSLAENRTAGLLTEGAIEIQRRNPNEQVVRLNDEHTASSVACIRRIDSSLRAEYNCRLRFAP